MGRWLRIAGGIVAGYLVAVLLSSGTTAILRAFLPVARAEDPPVVYLVFDLLYSLVFAGAGGWAAAKIGAARDSAFVLAALFLVLGIWTASTGLDQTHPLAYQWAAAVLGPFAVAAGGLLASESLSGNETDSG